MSELCLSAARAVTLTGCGGGGATKQVKKNKFFSSPPPPVKTSQFSPGW